MALTPAPCKERKERGTHSTVYHPQYGLELEGRAARRTANPTTTAGESVIKSQFQIEEATPAY